MGAAVYATTDACTSDAAFIYDAGDACTDYVALYDITTRDNEYTESTNLASETTCRFFRIKSIGKIKDQRLWHAG